MRCSILRPSTYARAGRMEATASGGGQGAIQPRVCGTGTAKGSMNDFVSLTPARVRDGRAIHGLGADLILPPCACGTGVTPPRLPLRATIHSRLSGPGVLGFLRQGRQRRRRGWGRRGRASWWAGVSRHGRRRADGGARPGVAVGWRLAARAQARGWGRGWVGLLLMRDGRGGRMLGLRGWSARLAAWQRTPEDHAAGRNGRSGLAWRGLALSALPNKSLRAAYQFYADQQGATLVSSVRRPRPAGCAAPGQRVAPQRPAACCAAQRGVSPRPAPCCAAQRGVPPRPAAVCAD